MDRWRWLSCALLTLAGGCGDDVVPPPVGDLPADLCLTPLAPNEPLCNRSVADSPWAVSHRSAYAQGSSPEAAPGPEARLMAEHAVLPGIPVVLAFSGPDADGGRTIWATLIGFDNAIAKLDHDSLDIIDVYVPADREDDPPSIPLGVTGAYSLVDAQNRFVVARAGFVAFYGDEVEGDRRSRATLLGRVNLPGSWLCGASDAVAGMGLTHDGALALVTERGNVIVSRGGPGGFAKGGVVASINGAACDDPAAELETVSNNLAVDEQGGVYVVSSAAMYRFDRKGDALVQTWRAAYEAEGSVSPIRLGPGSGSTPSLMGTSLDDDRFVVITDGQQLMHLVLMWRDEIPGDWEPIASGRDPRIACEVPIDFGMTGATESSSEQSVMVRGHGAVVVNNLVRNPTLVNSIFPQVQNLVTALEGGQPDRAPFGVQRVDWDPEDRACSVTWTNPDVAIPNGIPTMSEGSGLLYGVGHRDGAWGLSGLDYATGEAVLWNPTTTSCEGEDLSPLGILLDVPEVAAALEADPQFCENSLYAATTVGPDGMIYSGTFGGVSRHVPDEVESVPPDVAAAAGTRQGLDMVNRALGDPGGPIGRTEWIQRAARQLLAVVDTGEGPSSVLPALDQIAIALASDDDDDVTRALERARSRLDP